MLTHSYLLDNLHYSIITGQFYWLKSNSNKVTVGNVAGGIDGKGYRVIGIMGKTYYAHRLAWFLVTGEWPIGEVDHINGVESANYWLNLRSANRSQNMCNVCKYSNNTSGFKGVYWSKARGKWIAQIQQNGKTKNLGGYATLNLANVARLKAEKDWYKEFARI